MTAVEQICADLGIKIVPCNEREGPMRTKAGNRIRELLKKHGAGHMIYTLRTIVESKGNEAALKAPIILGVSDLILAHPTWPERGLAWIEAFDDYSLIEIMKTLRRNKKAVPLRAGIATHLYERLAPIFDPPKSTTRAFQAKARLADEYDAAQQRGEVRSDGQRGKAVPDENSIPTVEDVGLTRKQIHEARQIRDQAAR